MSNDPHITTRAPGQFSWVMAHYMLALSEAAYTRATIVSPKTKAQALVDILPAAGGDNPRITVALKGSSSAADFIQDAKFDRRQPDWASPLDPIEIHEGFFEDIDSIDVDLAATVVKALNANPGADIYVTGHSLGGALAVLGAYILQREGLPIRAVYTFGQPRVGNSFWAAAYAALLGDRTFRVVNENDIVARSPGAVLGYRHSINEIFLPYDGGWCVNPSGWSKAISDAMGLWGRLPR